MGSSGNKLPREFFCILTPESTLSWVYELFRQDIYWLSKPFSRFQLGKFKVFLIKIYLLWKNLTDFRKTVENGMDPRSSLLRSFVDKWLSPTYYERRICLYLTILGINAIDLLFKVAVNTESVIDASLVWINPIAAWNKQTICEQS